MTITSQCDKPSTVRIPIESSCANSESLRRCLLAGLLALAPMGIAAAVTPPATPPASHPAPRAVIVPSANARFQQTVQQNQATQKLQQAQVEQQIHQNASNSVRQPYANNPQMQQQIDQANSAQQNVDRSSQRDIINRDQTTPLPAGQVIVPQNTPPKAAAPKPAGGG
jgi:hypothetical protein